MKANKSLAILGEKVLLVPYRKEHVEKYHEWMLDPELRELTASESLTLEEEFEMQRKWQEDEDKLTFIVLSRGEQTSEGSNTFAVGSTRESVYDSSRMIGDVNLFFKGSAGDDDFEVEVEIMIAERSYRRNGFATEALQLLLSFATSHHYKPSGSNSPNAVAHSLPIPAEKFVARIGASNSASQALFAKLGFVVTRRVEIFNEVEMRLGDDDLTRRAEGWLKGKIVPLGDDGVVNTKEWIRLSGTESA